MKTQLLSWTPAFSYYYFFSPCWVFLLCSVSHCGEGRYDHPFLMLVPWTKSRRMLPLFRFRNGEMVQLPSSSLASMESLTVPQKQVIVLTADLRCSDGRKRVSDVLSRMDDDTWSVLVDSREKTVTLSCRFGGNRGRKSVSTGEKLQSLLNKKL